MFGKILVCLILLAAVVDVPAAEPPVASQTIDTTVAGPDLPLPVGQGMYTRLNWRSYEPYYLFAVVAHYRESPFADSAPAGSAQ